MIRPPVVIDRRRGRSEPPTPAAAVAATAAGAAEGKGPLARGRNGGVACEAALAQAQLRLEGLRGHMEEWASGPVVAEAVARRAELQVCM